MKNFNTKSFELEVNVKSAIPIYEQIKNAAKWAIFSGHLADGDKLISIRELSARYNINPITIMKAYSQLESEGYLYSRRGSGYFVKAESKHSDHERHIMFQKEVSEFMKRISVLGFKASDLISELKKYQEGRDND
jgi:GntR family transcriptional regulator